MRRLLTLVVSIAAVLVLGGVAAWTLDGARVVNQVHRSDRVQLQSTLSGLTSQYLQATFLSSAAAARSGSWQLRPDASADRAALRALV